MGDESRGLQTSTESSGIMSPGTELKHIHFNEQVEQYMAVDGKGMGVESAWYGDDGDSDDDVMLKQVSRSNPSSRGEVPSQSQRRARPLPRFPQRPLITARIHLSPRRQL